MRLPTRNHHVIRVEFSTGPQYHYRCTQDVQRGDWVVVPPNRLCNTPRVVQVTGCGRLASFKDVFLKRARLVRLVQLDFNYQYNPGES